MFHLVYKTKQTFTKLCVEKKNIFYQHKKLQIYIYFEHWKIKSKMIFF